VTAGSATAGCIDARQIMPIAEHRMNVPYLRSRGNVQPPCFLTCASGDANISISNISILRCKPEIGRRGDSMKQVLLTTDPNPKPKSACFTAFNAWRVPTTPRSAILLLLGKVSTVRRTVSPPLYIDRSLISNPEEPRIAFSLVDSSAITHGIPSLRSSTAQHRDIGSRDSASAVRRGEGIRI
jgi:hypothetical protein